MNAIFIVGTAGSGKSLLTSRLVPWFSDKGAYAVSVNLDPGAVNLPYEPDVDVRNYIDINTIMESYQLGPNGALILSSDMVASRLNELQDELDSLKPDYAIIDTPGQMELFAYRASGPYIAKNIRCEGKAVVFLFDATLVSTPVNLVSIALLAASTQLRLGLPQVPVLSKVDIIGETSKRVLRWSSSSAELVDAISKEKDSVGYLLSKGILIQLVRAGFGYELIPFSSLTMEGLVELSAALARIFKGGEEVVD